MTKGDSMNGRVHHDDTPEGRIAAVARSLCVQMATKSREPDYADFRDVFRPFLQRELLNARIDEARKTSGRALTQRVRELAKELQAIKFPDEFEL
jgi:hypothetical protein